MFLALSISFWIFLSLTRLKLYDDARNVANMIGKIEPVEVRRHKMRFDKLIQARRDLVAKNQDEERQRLNEFLTSLRWTDIRRREMESKR